MGGRIDLVFSHPAGECGRDRTAKSTWKGLGLYARPDPRRGSHSASQPRHCRGAGAPARPPPDRHPRQSSRTLSRVDSRRDRGLRRLGARRRWPGDKATSGRLTGAGTHQLSCSSSLTHRKTGCYSPVFSRSGAGIDGCASCWRAPLRWSYLERIPSPQSATRD